jgi:cytoskeletal protein RodZ
MGNRLKAARESKGYLFDQVSREINIAARYLEALEAEDFAIFPGEAYILGFLRNYSEYLGLDSQETLSLYRALKIQEQPIPVEQLLKSPSAVPKTLLRAGIVLAVLAAAGGGGYMLLNYSPPKQAVVEPRSAAEYLLSEILPERRFYRGDSILVPLGDSQYKLELGNLGETVTLATPVSSVILDLGQEAELDLNNDGITELRIIVVDFVRNNPAAGALLRFEMNSALPPAGAEGEALAVSDAALVPEGAVLGNTGLANATTIFTSPNAYPFTLQLAFQGYCMFRWQILFEPERQTRNEQYFQRSAELSIQAQNGVRIWASNAAAAKLQVIGGGRTVPLELGGAGEVVVVDVRWVRDEDNRYRLVLIRLE